MTIDEMIDWIHQKDESTGMLLTAEGEAIIAALRAGQAMRSSFKITPETEDESASASKVDFASLGEAGIAWDAATAKGDEG
jgi:hypothetical protein